MMNYLGVVLVLSLLINYVEGGVKFLGYIPITFPGIINTYDHGGSNPKRYSLLASTYSTTANSFDKAFLIPYPGEHISTNFTDYRFKTLFNTLRWPKQIRQVPYSTFNVNAVLIPDGSRVAGKTDGNIFLTNVEDFDYPTTSSMTHGFLPDKGASYTDAIWMFNPLLGKDNMMTCRVKFAGDLVTAAQLVYYDRPLLGDDMTRAWKETVLKDAACDTYIVHYTYQDILFDRWDVVYTTGQYSKRLGLYWPETDLNLPGSWDEPGDLRAVILSEYEEYFDIQLTDLNNDGRTEILVSVQGALNGSLQVWEIPDDFRDKTAYIHHELARGFESRSGDKGRSPGNFKIFYPQQFTNVKPWILLSGHEDGRAYILKPANESTDDWNYEKIVVADEGSNQIVSGVEVVDVDGDNDKEIFVSVHNKNRIQVYTYQN